LCPLVDPRLIKQASASTTRKQSRPYRRRVKPQLAGSLDKSEPLVDSSFGKISPVEIHQLRYFVAVADEGSFSRAAAREHVAQPSLSQQIQKLEAEMDQRLFDRLPRSVVPTEAGNACSTTRERFSSKSATRTAVSTS
jgi:hypothetical protein